MCEQARVMVGTVPPVLVMAADADARAARCGDAATRAAARRTGCSAENCPVALRVRCWLEAAARAPA